MDAKEIKFFRYHKVWGDIKEISRDDLTKIIEVTELVFHIENGEVIETDFAYYANSKEKLKRYLC